METCPKIPMLNFELKVCNYDSTDFNEKIFNVNKFFRFFYNVLIKNICCFGKYKVYLFALSRKSGHIPKGN
jgi:hypothetical protein